MLLPAVEKVYVTVPMVMRDFTGGLEKQSAVPGMDVLALVTLPLFPPTPVTVCWVHPDGVDL